MNRKRMIHYYLIFIILGILSACSKESVETELYQDPDLTIGVIGETTEVREENVEFVDTQLSDAQEEVYSYDVLKEWDVKDYEKVHGQKLSYFSAPIQSPYKYTYHCETINMAIDEIANALGTIMMEDFMQDYEGKTFVVTEYKNLDSHVFDEAELVEWEERYHNSGKQVVIEENQWICSFECDYKYTGVYCDIGTIPSDMEWMNTLITDGSGENYVFIIQKVDDDDYIMRAAPKTIIERKDDKN